MSNEEQEEQGLSTPTKVVAGTAIGLAVPAAAAVAKKLLGSGDDDDEGGESGESGESASGGGEKGREGRERRGGRLEPHPPLVPLGENARDRLENEVEDQDEDEEHVP